MIHCDLDASSEVVLAAKNEIVKQIVREMVVSDEAEGTQPKASQRRLFASDGRDA
jgi:hypothetical protein